jgi:hypothetical protein
LPPYQAWQKKRGPLEWGKQPARAGVWSSDGTATYLEVPGGNRRSGERELRGAPPLTRLCQSLRKEGIETVEALVFPVLPQEKP